MVYRATDGVTGTEVALKWWSSPERDPRRWQREVAALRSIALPGIVRLVDHGVWLERPYLAMELVEGDFFPGVPLGSPWEAIARPALSVLDTLIALHEAGFVHRDIKPHNVLVRRTGETVLLDFGLARSEGSGGTLTTVGAVLGTPAFLAPEVLLGERPTRASDLYSFGAMVYAALAGAPPHDGDEGALLRERVLGAAPDLPADAQAPSAVREVLRALLDPNPAARPAAPEALGVLGGALGATFEVAGALASPKLGPGLHRFHAPPGGGKSTFARKLTDERLGAWITARREPLAIARSVLGEVPDELTLDEVEALVVARLTALAERGAWVVIDRVEELDARSRALIEGCEGLVGVGLTSLPVEGARSVPRLGLDELRALFDAPEPIVHLPTDAAELLLKRTQGWPGLVAGELARWERAGRAKRGPNGWQIRREDLESMQTEVAARGLGLAPALDPAHDEALALIELAGGLSLAELTVAMQRPLWWMQAVVDELVQRAAVRVEGADLIAARASRALVGWGRERRARAHSALADAFVPGRRRRWLHLGLAGRSDEAGLEAIARARVLRDHDEDRIADIVLERALTWVRVDGSPAVHRALLEQLAVRAVRTNVPARVVEARRAWQLAGFPMQGPIVRLLEAAEHAFGGRGEAALDRIEADLEPGEDVDEELEAVRVLLIAASRRSLSPERGALARQSLVAWAERGDAERRAQLAAWDGVLAYTQGRIDDALDHLRGAVAGLRPGSAPSMGSRVMLAAALMDTGRLAEAREVAKGLVVEAESRRAPGYEARAWSILRHATMRCGEPVEPRPDLIAVAREHLDGNAAASLLGSEGCIAWRAGETALAQRTLLDAGAAYERFGLAPIAAFFVALAAAIGAEIPAGELARHEPHLARLPVGLRAQIAAFRVQAGRGRGSAHVDAPPLVTAEELRSLRGRPMLELLWPGEIEEMLGASVVRAQRSASSGC